jgi:hypothetical protein
MPELLRKGGKEKKEKGEKRAWEISDIVFQIPDSSEKFRLWIEILILQTYSSSRERGEKCSEERGGVVESWRQEDKWFEWHESI